MRLDMFMYLEPICTLIVLAGVVSLPLVVVCGLVERCYNGLFGMVTGKRVIKF